MQDDVPSFEILLANYAWVGLDGRSLFPRPAFAARCSVCDMCAGSTARQVAAMRIARAYGFDLAGSYSRGSNSVIAIRFPLACCSWVKRQGSQPPSLAVVAATYSIRLNRIRSSNGMMWHAESHGKDEIRTISSPVLAAALSSGIFW